MHVKPTKPSTMRSLHYIVYCHTISLDTDDDDQTCLDEFQECIEEYQECLEVVHICFDEENSFSHSPCGSQVEDLGENEKQKFLRSDVVDNNYINNPNPEPLIKNSESEVDLSYKSLGKGDVILIDDMNNQIINVRETAVERPAQTNSNSRVNKYVVTCNDSSTLSDKMPSSHLTQSSKCTDEKDGYETCVDESLSEDVCAKAQEGNEKTEHTKVQSPLVEQHEYFTDETTPTNSKPKLTHGLFCNASSEVISAAISDPCISLNCAGSSKHNHIHLDSKLDDDCELKSYDNPIESLGADEFFLVQYPGSELLKANDVTKYRSEPNVLEMPNLEQLTYKKCLKEYYNDYEDCLELYRLDSKKGEMTDEEIFDEIFLPFRSQSAPDVLDSSFVTLTYDPGPDKIRRKSTFVPGYQCNVNSESIPMTIIRSADTGVCCLRENQTNMIEKHWGSTHTVQIYREPNKSLGISIVGGRVDLHSSATAPPSETILGIFVKNVVDDSPAGKTGKFKTGDRILEVSGIDLRNTTHDKAVDAIRNATNPVTFTIQSLTPWTIETDNSSKVNHTVPKSPAKSVNFVTDEHVNNISDNHEDPAALMRSANVSPHLSPTKIPAEPVEEKPLTRYEDVPDIDQSEDEQEQPPKPVLSSSEDESDDDEEDVRHLEGRTVSAKGVEIDRASAGNVRRSKEEAEADTEEEDDFGYTANKVKKKYASLGQSILMVQLERSSQGLGLSLAGHKDRNCMAVFVCGLNPKGAAFRTGAIQVGDEILEVNGVVLHGRCHLNASAIIKGLSGPIFKVIILRRKAAINDIAVKPITQFPVSLADEASEEQFNNYPNVRTVTIKKGSQSLGIMIIEGKHAEVGQGIFISDIQEGSSADKAGLEIGEMILAVNKDSLLGSNYDSAAGLLKRTEGLVTLVVSNPGKKASTPVPADGDKNSISKSPDTLKTTAPPSRPSTPVPEPPADPATCPVTPGKDVTLDVMTDNKGLGAFFVGGKDTLIPNAIVLLEIYPGGPADKDGRLQPGDQILEVNSASLKDVTSSTAALALRQTLPKMKLVVHRPEHVTYTSVEVDLMKKSGKGLGLSVTARKNGKGVYVTDILSGGTADIDGRIMKGDILVSVNGQDVQNSSGEEAGAILKTVMGKVSLKLNRYKPASR